MQKAVQFVLCILVGFLGAASLLLDFPLKWEAAVVGAIGYAIFLLVCKPKHVLLLTIACVLPFYVGKDFISRPDYLGELRSVGFYLTDALIVGLLIVYLGRLAIRQGEFRLFPVTTIPAVIWISASALSLVNASDGEVAAIQLIAMGKLFLVYLVVANSVRDEGDVRWLVGGLLLGIFCQGLLGSYQGIVGRPLGLSFLGEPAQLFYGRSLGTIGHPNGYAMYLSATIPFALALQFTGARRLYRALAGIALCVGAIGLTFSFSRGGWASFVVASFVVLVLAVHRRRLEVRNAVMITSIALLIALALTLSQGNLIVSRLMSDDRAPSSGRIALANVALAIVQDHPLSGVGLNNYSLSMIDYGEAFPNAQDRYIVHNAFLLIFAETGLIGLAAFLYFLTTLVIQAWRLLDRVPNDTMWMAGAGIFCALVALIVHNMVDYGLVASVQIFTLFWFLAAIVAGLGGGYECKSAAPSIR